ncbi:MAG TPA: DoxX family protein [Chthoniobacteraceae bacterium]|nr:DoxX family protein [Chthoniobacteraceae bacterium]
MWKNLSNFSDVALLFLRLALGSLIIWIHGWPKLAGGLAKWKAIGGAMKHVGITFWPAFWGFMCAFSESIGMGLIVLGLLFRPSCAMLVITMAVATVSELRMHHGWNGASHPLELALVFFALMFVGPGKYSVDRG